MREHLIQGVLVGDAGEAVGLGVVAEVGFRDFLDAGLIGIARDADELIAAGADPLVSPGRMSLQVAELLFQLLPGIARFADAFELLAQRRQVLLLQIPLR